MGRRITSRTIVDATVLAAAVLYVFTQLHPALLLANTTAAGGDMGAHVWGPAYMRDHLLPHGRLAGWAQDWYAGFPAFHFYFPLPAALIVVADLVLPYNVAFKLVTVLGVLSLPVATYWFARLLGVKFPGPALMGLATLPFLFDRFHTIYGGNIAATLAGEYSFSIALSLALVFCGVLRRSLETGRHRVWLALLLAATALSHLLPTLFAVAGGAVLVLGRLASDLVRRDPAWRARLRVVLTSLPVAGLLTTFWALPFLWRLPYANDMGWEKITAYTKNLFPFLSTRSTGALGANEFYWQQVWHLIPVTLAATLAAVFSVVYGRRAGVFLTATAVGAALTFRYAPQARLWNARALPFWFLSLYLLAAFGAGEAVRGLAHLVGRARAATVAALSGGQARPVSEFLVAWDVPADATSAADAAGRRWRENVRLAAAPVALVVVLVFVALPLHSLPSWFPLSTTDRSFVADWARWNYSGYERKAKYPEYRAVVDTMARVGRTHGCGRAMWEYKPELNDYGTPMALMLLPMWTGGCIASMEGLFFESAASTPYHFLNQSELSRSPSSAQRDLPYRGLDVAMGVRHLQLMGVRYYMATSQEAIAQADANPDLSLVATSGPWRIYRVARSPLVEGLENLPAVATNGDFRTNGHWMDVSVPWYTDPARWDVPLAQSGPPQWPRVRVTRRPTALKTHGAGVSVATPPRRAVRPARVTNVRMGDDRVSFDVDRPGTPVLVKVSYFPNWQASGARGPWRVTPNFMVVVPTSTHVELHYGRTPVDWLGLLASAAGIVALVLVARSGRVRFPEPADPTLPLTAPPPGEIEPVAAEDVGPVGVEPGP